MASNDKIRIKIVLVEEIHRNEWLSNFINGHIRNPKWNKRIWKAIAPLKRLPWIGNIIRGKLIARYETKEA